MPVYHWQTTATTESPLQVQNVMLPTLLGLLPAFIQSVHIWAEQSPWRARRGMGTWREREREKETVGGRVREGLDVFDQEKYV